MDVMKRAVGTYNQNTCPLMAFNIIAYLHTCCMHYTQGSQSAAAKFSVKNVTKLLRFVKYHDPRIASVSQLCVEWGSTNIAGTSMFMMMKISTRIEVSSENMMGYGNGAFRT